MIALKRLTLAVLTTSLMGHAYAAERLMLNNVLITKQDSTETEIKLDFNDTPPNIKAYQVQNPARLIIDMPNTQNGASSANAAYLKNTVLSNYAIADNPERTRITFDLTQQGIYTTRILNNSIYLRLLSKTNTPYAIDTPVAKDNYYRAPAVAKAPTISAIDFKKGLDAEGNVIINLASPDAPVDVQQQGSKVVVKTLGLKVPDSLRRRLDVSDFSTTIKTIDAYNEGSNGVITIQTQGNIEQTSYRSGSRLTVSVKRPKVEKTNVVKKDISYVGSKLSLNFQDIDVRAVLGLIADFTNLNLVASDSVTGKITIQLKDVPWDQALDIIMRTKGLAKRKNGNVILIAPADELTSIEKKEAQSDIQQEALAPLQTEYIQLSYAKAEDVQPLIGNGQNSGGGASAASNTASGSTSNTASGDTSSSNGLLSNRGSIAVDKRTNTLIIKDTSDRLDNIRVMISKIDVPVKQVMIEARIVRAKDSFSKELGVKWGLLSKGIMRNDNLLVGGSDTTLFNLRNPKKNDLGGYTYTIDRPDNLSVDMGVTAAGASRVALGLLNMSDLMIDLELSALQNDGKGEVIATPKVLTADKQKAIVASGTQIPYQTSAGASGATSISFVNAELSLEVTPNITSDGKISMQLNVNSDTPNTTLAAGGAIAIDTNRVATNVLVDDGQTVVLGGIFQTVTDNSTTKVPLLGDLPVVGRLFRHSIRSSDKQELLIFVTPHLVNNVSKVTNP